VDFCFPMTIKDESESCGSRAVVASPSQENPRHYRMKLDVYSEVLQRLQESNYEEATLPDFEDQLWLHFNRLPARYNLLHSLGFFSFFFRFFFLGLIKFDFVDKGFALGRSCILKFHLFRLDYSILFRSFVYVHRQ